MIPLEASASWGHGWLEPSIGPTSRVDGTPSLEALGTHYSVLAIEMADASLSGATQPHAQERALASDAWV